jgi:predicted dehydrogenase
MSFVSRRGFIHTSMGVAAGSAMAGALPAWAAGAAVQAADEQTAKAPPSERLRIAVIGCGGRGQSHVDAFAGMEDVELVALCDPDGAHVGQYAHKVEKRQGKVPQLHEDLRRVLDDKSIDAVSIANQNHWHALATIWALQAGKHVYVEKPVSHNIFEGRRMVDFTRHHKKVVQVGTQRRSDADVQRAMKYIHDGGIGKLQLARALCYKRRKSIGDVNGPQPVPPSVHYGLWLGPAPERPVEREKFHYDWHWQWDYGNGDLGNQGVHQMDVALWGVNRKHLPRYAQSIGGRFGYVDDGETPNTQVVLLDYGKDEPKIIFEVRGLETGKVHNAGIGNIFHGTDGYVVVGDGAPTAAYWPSGEMKQSFEGGSGDGSHFANFVKAVKNNARPEEIRGDIETGHIGAGLCHLGNISYRLGRPAAFDSTETKNAFGSDRDGAEATARMIAHLTAQGVNLAEAQCTIGRRLELDPKSERFNDREANNLLTRDYRRPFVVPEKVV